MSLRTDASSMECMADFPPEALARAVLQQQQKFEPLLDMAEALQQLRDIAESVSERLDDGAPLGDVLFALNDQLFNVLDFHCQPLSRARPHHSLLHQALRWRLAEPAALAIIYISVGRWLGLPLVGCQFPGHFLVRYRDEQGGVFIDPAAGGVQLQWKDLADDLMRNGAVVEDEAVAELLQEVDDQQMVALTLRELKQGYLREGNLLRALAIQQQLMAMRPDRARCFRERGWLYELLGCPHAAAYDYSCYLQLAPQGDYAPLISQRLDRLLQLPQVLH